MKNKCVFLEKRCRQKINNKLFLLIGIVLLLNLSLVVAADGVYFYELSETEGRLVATLQPYQNGVVDVGSSNKRVYLEAEGNTPSTGLGYMQDVKISEEGGDNIIEFKENGKLSRVNPAGSGPRIEYKDVEAGGRFTFRKDGKGKTRLIRAKFRSIARRVFRLGNKDYDLPAGANVDYDSDGEKIKIELEEGGSFNYKEGGDESQEVNNYNNIKENGKFEINDGELIAADFSVTQEEEISVRGWKYLIPKDGKVKFEGKKVDIIVKDKDKKIKYPEKEENADEDLVFSFRTESGGEIILPNNNIFQIKDSTSIVNFRNNDIYFNGKDAVIRNADGSDDFLINNPDEKRDVYFAFEESEVKKERNTLFLGEDKIMVTSPTENGVGVFFEENNRLGIRTTSDNTISVQARAGIAVVERAVSENDLPTIKISGNSQADLDRRNVYAQGDKFFFNSEGGKIGNFDHGDFSAQIRVSLVNDAGKNLKDFDLYANERDQFATVSDSDFEGPLKFFKTNAGFYISAKMSFNQLSPIAQEYFDELDLQEQNQFTSSYGYNVALLESKLKELLFEPKLEFAEESVAEFQRKTGIVLTGAIGGLTRPRLRALMKFARDLPSRARAHVERINLAGGGGFWGYANPSSMTVPVGALDGRRAMKGSTIGVFFHEAFHKHYYELENQRGFLRDWNSIARGGGYIRGYSHKNVREDIATFGEYVATPQSYIPLMKSTNPQARAYRGKFALLQKHGFINNHIYRSVMKSAGLSRDRESVERYIREGKS